MKLKSLSGNPNNPRKIEPERKEALKKSLGTFGSLDGCVFNQTTGRLVTFHQRQVALEDGVVTVTKRFKVPAEDGTIALGHIEANGQFYPYREVQWDEKTENAAMILSNNHFGQWNFEILPDMLLDLDSSNVDLELTGFEMDKIEDILAPISPMKREKDKAEQERVIMSMIKCPKCKYEWKEGDE